MRFLIGIVLLSLPFYAFTQSGAYNFAKLDVYNGLSHNQVNAIIKDDKGFMWFGTLSGLNRYDGYSCKIFRQNISDSSSLLDNNILSLYELPLGKMWVSTPGGPCIYDPVTEKFDAKYTNYLQSLGLPPGSIITIVKGNNGRYWFLYDNQDLYMYSIADKKAKPFKELYNSQASQKITSVQETPDGKLWLLYQSGFLQLYDIAANKIIFSSTALQEQYKGNNIHLYIDSDGDLWIWSYSYAVFLFSPRNNTVRVFAENTSPSRLNSRLVDQIVQDDKGLIWVATDHGGITLIDKKNNFKTSYLVNNPTDPKSLGQNSIIAMYKDDNGIVWLGTFKQGVNYLNSSIVQFPHYHHQESNDKSLQYDDVNRFAEDKTGNIWIGTNGGGLIYFDRENNSFKQYLHNPNNKNSLGSNVIVSLWIDHEGILWIGTYFGGLNRFDGKNFTHYDHNDNDSMSLADIT